MKNIKEITTCAFDKDYQEIAFWDTNNNVKYFYVSYSVWSDFLTGIINREYNMKGIDKEEIDETNLIELENKKSDLEFFIKTINTSIKMKKNGKKGE